MDYNVILVRRPLILTLWSLLVLAIISGASADSKPQKCEPKFVILDASGKSTTFQEACVSDDPASKCQPTNEDCDLSDCVAGVGNITDATFIGDKCKGTIDPHLQDPEKFSISLLREDFPDKGVYNCTITYQYASECYNPVNGPHVCPCQGKVNLDLIIIVSDLELTVDSGDGKGPKKETSAIVYVDHGESSNKNISFECIEEATDSLHLTMNFELEDGDYVRTLQCPENSDQLIVDDNIVITRRDNDCILTIMNVSQEDTGNYSCNIYLPHSDSRFNSDWSNSISLVTKKSPVFGTETTLGLIATVFFAIVIVFIAVAVIPFVAIVGLAVYNRAKSFKIRGNQDEEEGDLLQEDSYTNYGAFIHSNLSSRPETPNPNADTLFAVGGAEAGVGAAVGPHEIVAEVETMLNKSISPGSSHGQQLDVTVHSGPEKEEIPQTGPASGESNDSNDDLKWKDDQLVRRNMKDETPPSSKPKTLHCEKCGKGYAEDRKEEFEFHVMENNCGQGEDTNTDKLDSMESKQGASSGKSSPNSTQFRMDTSGDSS